MSWTMKSCSLLLTLTYCLPACGQELAADISVETSREPDGRLRYDYLIENLPQSELAINAFVLDVGEGADIQSLEQPEGWIGDYDPAEDPFELGWVGGPQSEIAAGGSSSFSFTSPLEPGDVLYFIAELAPDGSDLGSILDMVAGPLVAPVLEIPGDYNDNGRVEQADLDLVLLNWNDPVASLPDTWVNERPTDGIVDQAELDGVLLNWNATAAHATSGSAAGAIPEPSAAVLLLIAVAAGSIYRSRLNRDCR